MLFLSCVINAIQGFKKYIVKDNNCQGLGVCLVNSLLPLGYRLPYL